MLLNARENIYWRHAGFNRTFTKLKEIEKSNIINKVAFIEIDILIFEKIVSIYFFMIFFSAYKVINLKNGGHVSGYSILSQNTCVNMSTKIKSRSRSFKTILKFHASCNQSKYVNFQFFNIIHRIYYRTIS